MATSMAKLWRVVRVNKGLIRGINLEKNVLSQGNIYATGPAFTVLPIREYGRKVRTKPQKISNFEYSGDLRTVRQLDPETVLYHYKGLEQEIEENDILRKLTSYEFASGKEKMEHKRELVRDRIIELFGPNSELEQEIALKTLSIREMLPVCIKDRQNKMMKAGMLKLIFGRRNQLTELRKMDHERFEWLLRELKIRYVIPRDREEYKGWRHNLRVATQDEALLKKRAKLEQLKAEFEAEKEEFYKQKAAVLAQIEKDLKSMGLDKDFLEKELVAEKERLKPHKILTWAERVKLGMTSKITTDYYG